MICEAPDLGVEVGATDKIKSTSIHKGYSFLYLTLIHTYMQLPIIKMLKKRSQVGVARLQDEILQIVYSLDYGAVLHGGTAIWRCYSGNRFSEDLDFYSTSLFSHKTDFEKMCRSHGLQVTKFKNTGNLLFSSINDGRTVLNLEVNLKKKVESIVRPYFNADGTSVQIRTLSAENIVLEKIDAYSDRRFIRDLYDIFHLLPFVEDKNSIKKEVSLFLTHIDSPVDEGVLKTIIYSGISPSFERMKVEIARWAK